MAQPIVYSNDTLRDGEIPVVNTKSARALEGSGVLVDELMGFVGGRTVTESWTFEADDKGQLVRFDDADPGNGTIPANQHPLWAVLSAEQSGAGQATFLGAVGVTLNFRLSAKTAGQFAIISAVQTALNVWTVYGDTAAA